MASECFYDDRFETNGVAGLQILICALNTPFSVISILANLLVVISIWRTPLLHTPSNVLLAGLAITDFSVSLVAQPAFQARLVFKLMNLEGRLCQATAVQSITGFSLCGASMMILTVISLDRYIALHLHLRYRELVTVPRMVAVLVFIWIANILGSLLHLIDGFSSIGATAAAFTALTLSISSFTYVLICRVVYRQKRRISSQSSTINMPQLKKSSWSMFLINFTFVACFVPCVLIRLSIKATGQSATKQSLYEFSVLFVFFNSLVNPFLYCWRFRRIRTAVMQSLKDLRRRKEK